MRPREIAGDVIFNPGPEKDADLGTEGRAAEDRQSLVRSRAGGSILSSPAWIPASAESGRVDASRIADECHDETIVCLHGGAVVRVPCSLDEVLAWFA
jgi:hypothetical protein